MHATLDCLTAMAACTLFAASAFAQSPRGIVLHKPSAIADELWHLNGPGRSAWSFYQNWAVRRKVVSRTHRCSAGEEFVNVRLAAYVQEITG